MGQEVRKKRAAAVDLQPTIPKSNRLLAKTCSAAREMFTSNARASAIFPPNFFLLASERNADQFLVQHARALIIVDDDAANTIALIDEIPNGAE